MRVTRDGAEVTTPEQDRNALRFKQLPMLALFRYLRGGDQKVYMKLCSTICVCVAGGRYAVYVARGDQLVVHYADATIEVGTKEVSTVDGNYAEVVHEVEGEDLLHTMADMDEDGFSMDGFYDPDPF